MNVVLDIGGEKFGASGARTISPGWTEIASPYVGFKEAPLPEMEEGDKIEPKKIEMLEKETEPPRRYTQAALVKELESRGLGTKATRAEVISTLYNREYIEGGNITVLPLGLAVYGALTTHCPEILSDELTAKLESEVEAIQERKTSEEKVLAEAKKLLSKIADELKAAEPAIGKELLSAAAQAKPAQPSTLGKCPLCGSDIVVIISKTTHKRFVGCTGYAKGCRFSAPLPQKGGLRILEKKCPKCGLAMVRIIERGRHAWDFCANLACRQPDK